MYFSSIILNDTQETQKAVSSPMIFFSSHNFCILGQAVTNGILFLCFYISRYSSTHFIFLSSQKSLCLLFYRGVYMSLFRHLVADWQTFLWPDIAASLGWVTSLYCKHTLLLGTDKLFVRIAVSFCILIVMSIGFSCYCSYPKEYFF